MALINKVIQNLNHKGYLIATITQTSLKGWSVVIRHNKNFRYFYGRGRSIEQAMVAAESQTRQNTHRKRIRL